MGRWLEILWGLWEYPRYSQRQTAEEIREAGEMHARALRAAMGISETEYRQRKYNYWREKYAETGDEMALEKMLEFVAAFENNGRT